MNRITVYDLYNTMREREQRHYDAFGVVLDRIYARIRKCAQVFRYDCDFEVPEIVIGKPLFDMNNCLKFVVHNLTASGFEVSYAFPRHLHISWDIGRRRPAARPSAPLDSLATPYDALVKARSEPIPIPPPPPPPQQWLQQPKKQQRAFRSISEFKPSEKFVLRI